MSNVWSVFWRGNNADITRRDLIAVGPRPVRCGGAGVIWMVANWSELTDERVGALLMPVDPATVSPAIRVVELMIPDGASPS